MLGRLLFSCLLMGLASAARAAPASPPAPTIHILSWKGTFTTAELRREAEQQCALPGDISLSEFDGIDEFLRLRAAGKHRMDILVFPEELYGLVAAEISGRGKPLQHLVAQYPPAVRALHHDSGFADNVVFLRFRLTGLLYDPTVLGGGAPAELPPRQLLQQARGRRVVLPDDYAQTVSVLRALDHDLGELPSVPAVARRLASLERRLGAGNLLITSDPAPLLRALRSPRFALAIAHTGDSLLYQQAAQQQGKVLQLALHPQLSQMSADLLVLTSNRPEAFCLATVLAGERFLAARQGRWLAPSPHGSPPPENEPAAFRALHRDFFARLPLLRRAQRLRAPDLWERQSDWRAERRWHELAPEPLSQQGQPR